MTARQAQVVSDAWSDPRRGTPQPQKMPSGRMTRNFATCTAPQTKEILRGRTGP
ncbi:hypothetical protein [Paracoccus niistensis]|uniref:Uncharacterized protein n=1 Tax=Paracoccus niistensis TaxID=632935 RepID=A0ABV6I8K7_9RHOB